jgi:tricorn protease-like protein
MMTQPAVSENQIAFIYAEDLWVANLDGSQPKRLTVDEGLESNQAFLLMVKQLPLVPSMMAMLMFILLLPKVAYLKD